MGMHRTHNDENAPPGYEGDAEDSRLVRNASVGKRAKPTLVAATSPRVGQAPGGGWAGENQGTGPGPTTPGTPYRDPFATGTGYIENSSSSSTKTPQNKTPIGSAITTDAILDAYDNASSYDQTSSSNERMPGGRGYSRFSAIRRPPQLDIDAVRKAQARGLSLIHI